MGQYTQRKRFDHAHLADEAASGLQNPAIAMPSEKRQTWIVGEGPHFWLYLSQQGYLITAATPTDPGAILPNYEFVSYAD